MEQVKVKELINAFSSAYTQNASDAMSLATSTTSLDNIMSRFQSGLDTITAIAAISRLLNKLPDDLVIDISDSDQVSLDLAKPFLLRVQQYGKQ